MSAAKDLLTHYQHVIDTLTVLTGDKGIFDVSVDGQIIFSKKDQGRHAEPGEVLDRFTELVGPTVERYRR